MTQLALFPDVVRLERVNSARNEQRAYRLTLWPDLFGGCALVREWGRIGQAGRVRMDPYPTEGAAQDALSALAQAKQRRGYRETPA
jgi:predicted DNA-binding WGR domain protein